MNRPFTIVPYDRTLRGQQTKPLHINLALAQEHERHEKLQVELNYLRSALTMNKRLVQDVANPLNTILTMAQLAHIEGGLNEEDCQALAEASSQLRDLMQCLQMLTQGTKQLSFSQQP